jgi:Tol biopolymer transport system component
MARTKAKKQVKRRLAAIGTAVAVSGGGAFAAASPAHAAGTTTRVSSSSTGVAGNAVSEAPWVTADGRYVGFSSSADNLVPNQTNFTEDAFVRDRLTGTTERVSVATDGTQAQYPSQRPRISADGRYVVFDSFAPNLVPGDTNGLTDVFLRDRTTRTTTRISVSATGQQSNGSSYWASITPDGRYVAYTSDATDLVPGATTGYANVYLLDRQTGSLKVVSQSAAGALGDGNSQTPVISANGQYVAFESQAANLVPGDTDNAMDVFVKDMTTGAVQLVSVTNSGRQFGGGGSTGDGVDMGMSADGRYVTFVGQATNANAQLYIRDRLLKTTKLISVGADGKPGDHATYEGSLSPNGRYVAFTTGSTNIVPGSPPYFNSYVRDLVTGTTTLASVTWTGTPITESTGELATSNIGVCFQSYANNVTQDTAGRTGQIYFHPL